MASPVTPALRRVDNLRSAAAIALDWATIAGVTAVSIRLDHIAVYLVAVAIIAGRMQAMWCLAHEATHRGLFKNRAWNDRLSDWLLLHPLLYAGTAEFRGWHMKHHSQFWKDEDPVAQFIRSLGRPGTTGQRIWKLAVQPVLGLSAWEWLVDHASTPRSWLPGLRLWLPVLVLAHYLGALHIVLLYWVVPLVWLFPVFETWSGVCDHYNTLTGTRSTMGIFARVFTHGHNNGYHVTHHNHPGVSWHCLPEGERLLSPDREVATGLAEIVHQIFLRQLPAPYGIGPSDAQES